MNAWLDQWRAWSVRASAGAQQPWVATLANVLARLIFGLCVVWLAWRLAVLFWLVQNEQDTAAYPAGETPIKTAKPNVAAPAVYDLFAGAAKPTKVVKPTKPSAPRSLRLTLHGVYATDDPKQGFALISSAKAKPKNYAVAAPVKPGVTLHEVYSDRVILLRGGDLIALRLPKNNQGIQQQTMSKPTAQGMPGDPVILQKPTVLRKLQRYRKQLQQNPMAMGRLINGNPVMRRGQIYGVRVAPGTDPLLMGELGLKKGDILISLNDTGLNDLKNLPTLLKTLSEDKQFELTLERNGTVQTLNIYLGME